MKNSLKHFRDGTVEVFGSRNFATTVVVLILVVTIHGVSVDIHHYLGQRHPWLPFGLFGVVFALFWLLGKQPDELKLDIAMLEDRQFASKRGLILFLSPPGRRGESAEKVESGLTSLETDINMLGQLPAPRPAEQDPTHPGPFAANAIGGHNWRMPIEAIWFHGQSKKGLTVVVITSPESEDYLKRFKKVVTDFCAKIPTAVTVVFACHKAESKYDRGFDFEDAEALTHAVNLSIATLEKENVPPEEIVIDITGGQKLPAVLGAAYSLQSRGRAFQYVSTTNYKIRAYDLTFRTPPAHPHL